MATQLMTAEQVRHHLVTDNYWTDEEVTNMFDTSGTQPRTEELWALAWDLDINACAL